MTRLLDHLAANLYVRRVLTNPASRNHGTLKRRYWASRRVNRAYWRYTFRRLHAAPERMVGRVRVRSVAYMPEV